MKNNRLQAFKYCKIPMHYNQTMITLDNAPIPEAGRLIAHIPLPSPTRYEAEIKYFNARSYGRQPVKLAEKSDFR